MRCMTPFTALLPTQKKTQTRALLLQRGKQRHGRLTRLLLSDHARMYSEICIQAESLGAFTPSSSQHTCFLVLPNPLLEEVSLSLQRDQLHPIERILRFEDLWVSKRCEQSVSDELNVFRHHLAIHTDQIAWQCLTNEEPLGCDCPLYEVVNHVIRKLVLQHAVDKACKLGMQTLVPGDQLIREGQTWHPM